MTALSISRPAPNEAAPYYHGYIAEVAGENVGEQLVDQLAEVERLFGAVDDAAALMRYAPGKWSIKELLGHLADAERIFAYRLLRIARGDATPLPGFDENAYVPAGRFDDRPLSALTAEFRAVRLSSVALISGLPLSSWSNMGQASGNPVSAGALVFIMLGHVMHHLRVLRERYGLDHDALTVAGNR